MTLRGYDALQRRLRAIGDQQALLRELQLSSVEEAKGLVPVKTTNLKRTIRVGQVTQRSAFILAGGTQQVGYAAYVEFGTKPHDIRPLRAKALAWGGSRRLSGRLRSGSSPTHFAKRVHHPGTAAKPYLVPGARRAVGKRGLGDRIVTAWNRAA